MLFALLGGIVLFQAIFNLGCCGSSGCDINHADERVKSFNEQAEDITFKEVK